MGHSKATQVQLVLSVVMTAGIKGDSSFLNSVAVFFVVASAPTENVCFLSFTNR